MEQKLQRVARHLYRRQYQAASGDWTTLYYGRFVCRLKKKRRLFALGPDSGVAKDKLKKLEAQDVDRYYFDLDKQRVETKAKVTENRNHSRSVNGRKNIPRSTT